MAPLDFTVMPPADHAEIISRLRELHDEAEVTVILDQADFLAERAAIGLYEVNGDEPEPAAIGLATAMMMGALQGGLRYLGASEESALLACRAAIDTFNAKLATMQAGAAGMVRH